MFADTSGGNQLIQRKSVMSGLGLTVLYLMGCMQKQVETSPVAAPPVVSQPAPDLTHVAEPPPLVAPVTDEPAVFSVQDEVLTVNEGELPCDPDEPTIADSEIDADRILEEAMTAYDSARQAWSEENSELALADLDRAYAAILKLDHHDEDLSRQREDLRYLISKRIVEIHAARRMAVGNMNDAIPIVINSHVEREIRSFQKRERGFFLRSYKRSGRYRPMILEALRKEGLPEQLSWLPLIESGFVTSALSRARALGLWQFIPSTGYRYGLKRGQWVDERMDPEKATVAAIQYLTELHNLFGDWHTALAAYNCGEGRVMRTIKGQRINYLDDFWDLYQQLPSETARYVPRFIATLAILEDPAKYGFELPEPDSPPPFEHIEISRPVSLKDLDALAGVSAGTFKRLNPELRYAVTPDQAYALKVPQGKTGAVEAGVPGLAAWSIPSEGLVHRVRRGDTLSSIAKRYRTSVSRIASANNMNNRHRIWPGQKLKIPGRQTKPARMVAKKGKVAETSNSNRVYQVRKGDTMAKIARRHGVRLNRLLEANNLSKRDNIYPNQTIVVPE